MMSTPNDFSVIAALELESIKTNLMHETGGKGWSLERASAAEREYRCFLYLMKKFPNESTAPPIDVDTFWHHHILDTLKYADDCERVFGYFLHHHPYLGLGLAGDDTAVWQGAGERMRELYEQTFGEPYQRIGTGFCTAPTQAFCTTAAQAFCTTSTQAFCTTAAHAFCTTSTQAFCTAPARSLCTPGQAVPAEEADATVEDRQAMGAAGWRHVKIGQQVRAGSPAHCG